MQVINELGIDVSAASLAVCIQRGTRRYPVATFDNTTSGHRTLIGWATKSGRSARVCVEATGVYSLDLALALHRQPKIEVMVINPRASRSFAQAMMKRAKTDPVDAEVILEFVLRMPFITWQPPPCGGHAITGDYSAYLPIEEYAQSERESSPCRSTPIESGPGRYQ